MIEPPTFSAAFAPAEGAVRPRISEPEFPAPPKQGPVTVPVAAPVTAPVAEPVIEKVLHEPDIKSAEMELKEELKKRPPIVLLQVGEQINQAIISVKQVLKLCKSTNRCGADSCATLRVLSF